MVPRCSLRSMDSGRTVENASPIEPIACGWKRSELDLRISTRMRLVTRVMHRSSRGQNLSRRGNIGCATPCVSVTSLQRFLFQQDDVVTERPPTEADKICPDLLHCDLDCELAKDEGGCSVCACQAPTTFNEPTNETVVVDENLKKICPEVKCDLHCERGLVMDENDCTFCKCRAPESSCPPLMGCKKRCSAGYKTNKRGCPVSTTFDTFL